MEKKYEIMTIFKFWRRFPDNEIRITYLENLMWKNNFACPQCENTNYCKVAAEHNRQCMPYHYIDSPTSGTFFHSIAHIRTNARVRYNLSEDISEYLKPKNIQN